MPENPSAVAVIGAGPAGLMAAIAAAEAGAAVSVLERQPAAGRKLSATGGGRCNLTNGLEPDAFLGRFGTGGRFMGRALREFGRDALLRQFADWGVPCSASDGFHYFPDSQKAADVVNALLRRLRELGVRMRTSATAAALLREGDRLTGIRLEDGVCVPAGRVVLAAGGAAWPSLGGCTLGYALAASAGHSIVEPAPALTGLSVRETWPGACAGVTMPAARGWIDLPAHRRRVLEGIVLFTHAGVSGPLILDLSGSVTPLLRDRAEVPIRLALDPSVPRTEWDRRMRDWHGDRGKKTVRNLLDEHLPHSLALAACAACGIGLEVKAAQLTAEGRNRLADWLAAAPLTVTGSEGMARAMVTRGGVDLREVNPATLESRLAPGLHFAGEVLDIDGPCGGYNLQWAFSSGRLAGRCAAKGDGP